MNSQRHIHSNKTEVNHVHECISPIRYRFGKSDPVCVVRAYGDEVGATKCIKNTLDPIWDKAAETFEAPVAADGALAEITIEVCHTSTYMQCNLCSQQGLESLRLSRCMLYTLSREV
jgi:C2 domain